jgi:hypothetical protein
MSVQNLLFFRLFNFYFYFHNKYKCHSFINNERKPNFSKGFKIKGIPQVWFLIFFKGVHNKGYPTYGLIVSLIMKGNLIFKRVQNKGYPQAWFLIFF